MFYVDGLWLMLLGVLAVPGLIIAKRPDAKKLIDKLAPYQGWIGAVSAIYGVLRLLTVWIHSFGWLGHGMSGLLSWILYTVFIATMIVLGFMLGIGVIKSFVKDANAQAKMDEMLAKLAPRQGMLGLVALIDGVALFLWQIVG